MVTNIQIKGKLKFYTKPYGRQWKWRYQVHGHMFEPKLNVPKELSHVQIIDPLHPEPLQKDDKSKWIPPRRHPILESFFPQLTLKDHPNYNKDPIKLFDKTVKLHAGIDQACFLTKAKPVYGLPSAIKNFTNEMKPFNNESLIKNYIKQALAFNPDKQKVPGLEIPHDPKFHIGSQYGTPHQKQMQILVRNLLRLCNISLNKKYPNTINERKQLENVPFMSTINRGNDIIQIRRNNDFSLITNKKPKAIATKSEVDETNNYQFIDMYPIFPTVDLKDENIYKLDEPNLVGWKLPIYKNPTYLHTFFHLNDDNLTTEQEASRLIMFAFSNAYLQSLYLRETQNLKLDENKSLLEPIVVNGVSLTNEKLNYVTFQLNTLNLTDNSGVKNIVYYDLNNELYLNRPTLEKLPYPTLKNLQRLALMHLEYNPAAFDKLLSVFAFGSSA